jgi:hypothetical protein
LHHPLNCCEPADIVEGALYDQLVSGAQRREELRHCVELVKMVLQDVDADLVEELPLNPLQQLFDSALHLQREDRLLQPPDGAAQLLVAEALHLLLQLDSGENFTLLQLPAPLQARQAPVQKGFFLLRFFLFRGGDQLLQDLLDVLLIFWGDPGLHKFKFVLA